MLTILLVVYLSMGSDPPDPVRMRTRLIESAYYVNTAHTNQCS